MSFPETYAHMNESVRPSPTLVAQTLEQSERHLCPWRRIAAAAAAAALLLATPALAVRTEAGYHLLYQISPVAAQFFQPVQMRCTDQGITMEVAGVRVEGDTAQACITLSGGSVDETTDLFDSFSFHLPFDQTGHCERLDWDAESKTITFLCTVQTIDGSPIPTGGKMTFSVRQLPTGKETRENASVRLDLAGCAAEAETALARGAEHPADGRERLEESYFRSGGSGDLDLADTVPMLLPGPTLAEPAKGLTITAAGYADGLFHIQLCRGDATHLDNHGCLWLEAKDGTRLEPLCSAAFTNFSPTDRLDYEQFAFDIPPEDLPSYTLYGNFFTTSALTEGLWQVTFPLENHL